jgi:hypothetical protein
VKKNNDIALVPFSLRDHLVPFFFNEFKSQETVVMPDVRTKAIKLNKHSSLCRIIGLVHARYEADVFKYEYKIQFTIKEVNGIKRYQSILYKNYKHIFLPLAFERADNLFVNGFFEDIFRTAFLYYVTGYNEVANMGGVTEAINDFMDKYELLETGFDPEALRVLYYRERKSNKLSRFQHKIANRVTNKGESMAKELSHSGHR